MKNGRRLFKMIIAAGIIFATGSTAAAFTPDMQAAVLRAMPAEVPHGAPEHCGCDEQQGIELYVYSLINDAVQRGMICEAANTHIPACITVWCSICKGHPGLVEHCIQTGFNSLAQSAGSCFLPQASGQLSSFSAVFQR